MSTTHVVKQGEGMSRIARIHGFARLHTIWDRPENAQLRSTRPDPNVLAPGDKVFIPDHKDRKENCATGKRHHFVLSRDRLKLRLTLKDLDEQPIPDVECTLTVEGGKFKLTSDAGGMLEADIPDTAESGELDAPALGIKVPIHIGHLDPVDSPSGQHARLNNLGYDAGPLEKQDEKRLGSAVEEFQCDHGIKVTGACDPKTQDKLREIHGS